MGALERLSFKVIYATTELHTSNPSTLRRGRGRATVDSRSRRIPLLSTLGDSVPKLPSRDISAVNESSCSHKTKVVEIWPRQLSPKLWSSCTHQTSYSNQCSKVASGTVDKWAKYPMCTPISTFDLQPHCDSTSLRV